MSSSLISFLLLGILTGCGLRGASALASERSAASSSLWYGLQLRSTTSQKQKHRRQDEFTNQSDDSMDLERVYIGDFKVVISGTENELKRTELDQMHNEIQAAIYMYIEQNKQDLVTIDYIFMRQMEEEAFENQKTTLSFPEGGIAAFRGSAPTAQEMDAWVRDAVESQLSSQLRGTSEFSSVESTTYVSDWVVDSGSPEKNISPVQQDERTTDSGDDHELPWIIIISAGVGGMVAAVLLFLFVSRKRHSRPASRHLSLSDTAAAQAEGNGEPVEITSADISKSIDRASPGNTAETWEEIESEERRPQPRSIFPRAVTDESKSQAGSESSFTVNSEAGDSTGLQSLHHQAAIPAALRAESFERDRRVNLRKDMLTSPWAGQGNGGRTAQVESVLAPSHFSASQERRARNTGGVNEENADAWANGEDVGKEGVSESLRFESAAGDDAFLNPPSSRGKKSDGELV